MVMGEVPVLVTVTTCDGLWLLPTAKAGKVMLLGVMLIPLSAALVPGTTKGFAYIQQFQPRKSDTRRETVPGVS